MREILFRGKRVDNGEWVEGYYVKITSTTEVFHQSYKAIVHSIFPSEENSAKVEVIPSTVGQYTGLTDKNGKRIFEGDIVHAVYQSNYVGCENIDYGIGVVEYCDSYYGGASYQIDIIGEIGSRVFTASLEKGVEVIGNVHDNKELLKGE